MARVTKLTPVGGDQVRVQVDGLDWRVMPTDAAARAGLLEGVELRRERLRRLRRELLRSDALDVAARLLRERDRSAAVVERSLVEAGIAPSARRDALEALERAGYVDDDRLVPRRAATLAARGAGDRLIRERLAHEGFPSEAVERAVDGLPPERERATRLLSDGEAELRTARRLGRKGFSDETIAAVTGIDVATEP
ncbi:MAG: RecX family transcriptional regulator [Actinomycetota bacterium]|nr:RecX family transcriptional regulator [Actinomycetota bacterium]